MDDEKHDSRTQPRKRDKTRLYLFCPVFKLVTDQE